MDESTHVALGIGDVDDGSLKSGDSVTTPEGFADGVCVFIDVIEAARVVDREVEPVGSAENIADPEKNEDTDGETVCVVPIDRDAVIDSRDVFEYIIECEINPDDEGDSDEMRDSDAAA